jgi:hypothetical protein
LLLLPSQERENSGERQTSSAKGVWSSPAEP